MDKLRWLGSWAGRLGGGARPLAGLDLEADELIEESRARANTRLEWRQLVPALALGLSFLVAAVPMAVLLPSDRSISWPAVTLLVLCYAVVSRIEFEVGAGSAVPTQLVLVPMLFVLPPGDVPLCVAAGYVLGNLADHLRGGRHITRAFGLLGSSWHSVGPALVLVYAGDPEPSWSAMSLLALALPAQFACDFASAAVHDRLARGVSAGLELRLMSWVYLVDAALAPVGLMAAIASHDLPYAFLLVLPLAGLLGVFARERKARIDHALELSQAYRGTAFLLGDVVEADDAYTGSHSHDVVELVLSVCERLGLPPRERRKAELAALVHDVGKIRVPGEIINKPGGLTPAERAVIETHTIEGEKLLERVGGLLGEVGHIVRSCHEHWDGTGYPDGLAREEIPLVARIVSTCDAFNAMTTTRSYRAALPPETAIAELRAHAGTQFDPKVVRALVELVEAAGEERVALAAPRTATESLQAAY